MSAVAEVPTQETRPVAQDQERFHSIPGEEFNYRPMPMSVILAAILTLLSVTALFAWQAILIAAVATVTGLVACLRVRGGRGELSGGWLAVGATLLSLTFGVTGVLLTAQRYRAELPDGYERVSFARDISARGIGMEERDGTAVITIPDEVRALEGKRVFVKGFIYPSGRPYDIRQFVLCKDNAQCCFGGQPKVEDMIGVVMAGQKTTDFTTDLTGVAGTFKINKNYQGGSLEPLYLIEAEHAEPALTSL